MFLCCCRKSPPKDDFVHPILDIQKVVQDHVWGLYLEKLKDKKVPRPCVRRSNYTVEVPMHYFLIEQFREPRIKPRVRQEDVSEAHALARQVNKQVEPTSEQAAKERKKEKRRKRLREAEAKCSRVEIATDFTNDTELPQTYKFRLEKTRSTTLNVSMQKGFSIGGNTNVKLGLPKAVGGSISGGLDMKVTLTKAEGDTFTETVTLEATSDIQVKDRSKYVSKVYLTETQVEYDFTAWTKISLPVDGVPVAVKRTRDGHVTYQKLLVDLEKPFKDLKAPKSHVEIRQEDLPPPPASKKNPQRPVGADTEIQVRKYIVITSKGVIEGVRLSDQEIRLESHKLPPNTSGSEKQKNADSVAGSGSGGSSGSDSASGENGSVKQSSGSAESGKNQERPGLNSIPEENGGNDNGDDESDESDSDEESSDEDDDDNDNEGSKDGDQSIIQVSVPGEHSKTPASVQSSAPAPCQGTQPKKSSLELKVPLSVTSPEAATPTQLNGGRENEEINKTITTV